jgi:hypothetical protein
MKNGGLEFSEIRHCEALRSNLTAIGLVIEVGQDCFVPRSNGHI